MSPNPHAAPAAAPTCGRRLDLLLWLLLALCITRLWLMPLPSSFWLDEMATVFVVRNGPTDPSLAAAPQVAESIYYALPRRAQSWLGFSEVVYRLPSLLAMAIALYLVARVAGRLLGRESRWFVAFACLGLRGINDQAADARPYALGACVAVAGVWFLIRWLDCAHWSDALLFAICAGLLWRVHLTFWPFYLVFVLYTLLRLARRETPIGWLQAGGVFAVVALALAPVLVQALALLREARAHVIVPLPSAREVVRSLKLGLIAECAAGAWIVSRSFRWSPRPARLSWASATLILGWWLCQPLALFCFSRLTGDSVFVDRYLLLSLPGAALTATALALRYLPPDRVKPCALALGVGALLALGQWHVLWPPHHHSDWRAAAQAVREASQTPGTPVICPSPFIEARSPAWRPDYPLPGFLYAHLPVYPILGRLYLLPYRDAPEADRLARHLCEGPLLASNRFALYGSATNVPFWSRWFARQPELVSWSHRSLGPFGDVDVVVFEKPAGRVPRASAKEFAPRALHRAL